MCVSKGRSGASKIPFFLVGRASVTRDAPHRAHPAKIETENTTQTEEQGAEKEEIIIDTLTPALDDHCSIAAYLRLCPPTCPNRDIQGENTTLSSRGSGEGCNKRLPPDREQYIQQPQRASTSLATTDKGRT
jgi:hypothetical protein